MKESTIKMLKALKRISKDNVQFAQKAGEWLEN